MICNLKSICLHKCIHASIVYTIQVYKSIYARNITFISLWIYNSKRIAVSVGVIRALRQSINFSLRTGFYRSVLSHSSYGKSLRTSSVSSPRPSTRSFSFELIDRQFTIFRTIINVNVTLTNKIDINNVFLRLIVLIENHYFRLFHRILPIFFLFKVVIGYVRGQFQLVKINVNN